MIFYFTATGNSLYAARMLDEETVSIPQALRAGRTSYTADRIGIAAPIYGHELPAMVKEFIEKTELNTDYLYVILTYGHRHANAVELAQRVLAQAGRNADYIRTLLMVDNFLPAFDMEEEVRLEKNVDGQLAVIRSEIDARRHFIEPVTSEDWLAHAGYMMSVGGRDASVWANFRFTDQCIGCGICTKVCPAGCIHMEGQRAVRTGENCQACMACIHACPIRAIQMNPVCGFTEKNPQARYRNEHVTLSDLAAANSQPAGQHYSTQSRKKVRVLK